MSGLLCIPLLGAIYLFLLRGPLQKRLDVKESKREVTKYDSLIYIEENI